MILGVDTHKRNHTFVSVDGNGRQLKVLTGSTTTEANLAALRWAIAQSDDRLWAVEDNRSMSRRSERDVLLAGERVVRVPTKMMSNCRDGARTYGKSDPIDALAIEINELKREISERVAGLAPALLLLVGFGALNAARVVAQTAGQTRFRSAAAFARYNGTAPLLVWSSNHERHRLSRAGNRQLNSAIHIAALTQVRCHPGARELYRRRIQQGDGTMEALRIVKRRISDAVFRALAADQNEQIRTAA